MMNRLAWSAALFSFLALATGAAAQTDDNLAALGGLAPMSALPGTDRGRAALAANLATTGAAWAATVPVG
jgi:hypothetical protein